MKAFAAGGTSTWKPTAARSAGKCESENRNAAGKWTDGVGMCPRSDFTALAETLPHTPDFFNVFACRDFFNVFRCRYFFNVFRLPRKKGAVAMVEPPTATALL